MTAKKLSGCEFAEQGLVPRLELTVPGDVQAISPAVDRILTTIRQMGCAVGKEFEIEVALQEALANAVLYGCQEDPDKEVQICVACDEDRRVTVVVRDPGPGFDLEELPSPVVGEQLLSNHGRGIFLINQLMDEVDFRRRGTEIWMRKGTTRRGAELNIVGSREQEERDRAR